MPAIAAHHFFAYSVLKRLSVSVRQQILLEERAFGWGTQGPDILFYYIFPTGQPLNLGMLLHQEKIGPSFHYLTKVVSQLNDPVLFSYLMGYVCHYCLDRETHPFINSRCQQIVSPHQNLSPIVHHRMLEADLDRAYVQQYASQTPVRQFSFSSLNRPAHRVIHPIACLLAGLGRNLYTVRTKPALVEESMRLMEHVQQMLFDPKGTKKQYLFRLERITGYPGSLTSMILPDKPLKIDSLNLSHRPWQDQNGIIQTEDYWSLEQKARDSASSLIPYLISVLSGSLPFPFSFFDRDYYGIFLSPCL